ncbi:MULTISPECIES: LacI family DNA-binding transcriptional regulator [Microbacterium]|uniref:LacI family transcriptional regulator n=1 Tax=Microbacterium wangchenii TaxID=2541726 RepID=A0ABX5SRF7_9MICO|nr:MULTISPECIES: LacI family DNA-binding transcriptional regulator [Microbacterium]MCK6066499.1 LacI family transcriptional regulator [Microbacterium sp. EYE_512]QBR87455.1 LacI family transcriptional regulator [Microbacterium wangchenii]TFV84435.1 LacI family transcriptional regulator [Microbacterium sp. dk485]TXK14778.1 LacI family transcriptional regulator [Microbacterium wangchenii]
MTTARESVTRPTIREVAEAAGVSRSTASRAMSGNGYVARDVRERVRAAAKTLGYVVDATARGLKQGTSRAVGVLVSDLRNVFYAELASGIGREARIHGRTLVLVDLHREAEDELAAAEALVASRVSGVIATPVSAELSAFLSRVGVPLIEVDRRFDSEATDAVVVDNRAAARESTSRLIDAGHRRIALLIDETEWTTGEERLRGYRDALTAHGIPVDESLVVPAGWDTAAATETARELLSRADRPTAVFAANNVLTEGVWRAAAALELPVPDQLSIVGFDDAPWMTIVEPGVSTSVQDVGSLGSAAMRALLERIESPAAPVRTIVMPTTFIDRGSIAPPPA